MYSKVDKGIRQIVVTHEKLKKPPSAAKWLFFIFLPKLPMFLLALPFVALMRLLRPLVWIRLIPVYERIGHGIGNTDMYLLERRAGLDASKTIDIFYPDRPWKCNRQMIKMWRKVIPLYDWVYWIAWADKEISGYGPHHYIPVHNDRDVRGLSNDAPPPVSFSRQEEDRGARLLRDMGIPAGSSIVCFHGRDAAYQEALAPNNDYSHYDFRDVDINSYIPAIKTLVSRGYYCVRMGNVVKQPFGWQDPHVIDYATSKWRSDFADMYLISRCHFYAGNSCGVDAIAVYFRKPRVVLNMIPIKITDVWAPSNLFIYKKLWSIQEKRLLTFKEIMNSGVGYFLEDILYKQHGLEVVNNTPEEVVDVMVEKDERMRGSWKTNDEYEELQRRFWALYTPDRLNQVFKARVGSKFLLQNQDLLD